MNKIVPAGLALAFMSAAAHAQSQLRAKFGEEGMFEATWSNMTLLAIDPVFLGIVIAVLVIASRFFYWAMIPIGAVAGVIGIFVSDASYGVYRYDPSSAPGWGGAMLDGLAAGVIAVVIMRMIGGGD